MKLITLNCNGIRSAKSKGLFEFIKKQKADIIAFQEIKAEQSQMNPEFFEELGYIPFIFSAQKKGIAALPSSQNKNQSHMKSVLVTNSSTSKEEAFYSNLKTLPSSTPIFPLALQEKSVRR